MVRSRIPSIASRFLQRRVCDVIFVFNHILASVVKRQM